MNLKSLEIRMLNDRIGQADTLRKVNAPASGWISAIRSALNMTLAQLGDKLGMSRQGASSLEQREAMGSITLNSLRVAADALDMQLVYAIVPKSGNLEEYVERRARQVARETLLSVNQQMRLEAQAVNDEELRRAVDEAAGELIRKVDRRLWD